jgi:hypothetical protein
MPDLNSLLKNANSKNDTVPAKKKFSRGIRPDHIARGEVLENSAQAEAHSHPLKTEHKVDTNCAQTEHKVDTNCAQTEHKVDTKNVTKFERKVETEHKPDTKPNTEIDTKWTQTEHKVDTKPNFSSLIGLQKVFTVLVYKSCQKNRSKKSEPLTISYVANLLNINVSSIKTTFRRLEEKGILARVESKNGRGGWFKFEMTKSIYAELLQLETEHKLDTKWTQTEHKPDTKPDTEPNTSFPIVVVPNSLSLKTTNTESSISEQPCFVIPNELSGMVSRRQLSQFVLEGKISESELQMSLDAFAYDLKNKLVSTKHTANPVGLLIGAIKNNGGYNSQKFAEALKSEMKTALSSQQTLQDSISEAKSTEGWAKYQEMKTSSPEAFQALISKYEKQGLKGELLEEFGFLEFQEQQAAKISISSNPLRPVGD